MDDRLKIWTTVGSAGTLSQADLAKVTLHQSIMQLGMDLPTTSQLAAAPLAALQIGFPTIQAVARYNVTPVDGLFGAARLKYGLQLRFRGHVSAKLMEVDLASGNETPVLLFDSAAPGVPPHADFLVWGVTQDHDRPELDFVKKAYYVEAMLTASAIALGHPAAISIIKLNVVR